MKKTYVVILALVAFLFGCGAATNKLIARTALDVAKNACELYATQAGLAIEAVCATQDQLRPFLDAILAAQAAAASQRAGACVGVAAPAASVAPATSAAPAAPAPSAAPADKK